MEQKYIAFISYRHAQLDAAVAKQLHTSIEQFVIPKALRRGEKKLGKVFRDLEELPASSNLSDDIYRALDNSQYLIVICSRAMTQSPWVTREVLYFLEHHDQDNVFTVLVDGEPGEVFPKVLLQKTMPDGTRVDVEPLAMDVRAESQAGTLKKVRREISRLLAALVGCPYDALVQRQQKRQRRRLLIGAGLVLSVALLFSAVMLVKNRQIDAKNEQLEQTNRQLEEQKAEIQLRESELLTGKAQQLLDSGDLGLALPYALDALDGDRPYYAPAEQALISSLGIFDKYTDHLLVDKYITQTTPVVSFGISTDGRQIATIDPYGIVRCFDTVTEEQLWQAQAEADARIFVCGDRLLMQGIKVVAAVDFATGQLCWEQNVRHEENILDLHYAMLSGDQLMLLGYYSYDQYEKEEYVFAIVDTATGSRQESLVITQGQSILSADKYPFVRLYELGAADGRYFVGAWREDIAAGQTAMHMFRVDLEAMTCQEMDRFEVAQYTSEDKLYSLDIYGNCAYVLQGNNEKNGLMTVRAYDLETAQPLWQTSCISDNVTLSIDPTVVNTAFTENYLTFSAESYLYWLNRHTGEELLHIDAESETVLLESFPEGVYRIFLADGRYGYIWPNSLGQLSYRFGAQLFATSQIQLYDSGFLQMPVEDGKVGAVTADGTGFTACLTKEDDHRIAITRSVGAGSYFPVTELAFAEETDRLTTAAFWQTAEGKLIMGPISLNTEEAPYNRFVLLDPNNPQNYQNLYAGSKYATAENLSFTADGEYCLECSEGDVKWYDTATGAETVLAEKETVELLSVANVVYTTRRYITESDTRNDGVTVAARLEEAGISLWLDGQQTYVAAPEGAVLQQQVGNGMYRGLWVGGNGCVIATDFTDPEDSAWDRFLVYDTVAGAWSRLVLDERIDSCQIALGQTTHRAVLVHGQSQVAVYDLKTGNRENSFDLLLPQDAVKQMQLILQDQYLLVQTKDEQVVIYDLQNGQMIYQRQLESYNTISTAADGNRLYISWQSGGMCLDIGSWQELTDIPNMCWYDTGSRQLVLMEYAADSFDEVIKLRRLPDTQELLQIARTLLQR